MSSLIKLDMVSRLIFELTICYSRYGNICVGLTPAGKKGHNLKYKLGSPEMNSHWR